MMSESRNTDTMFNECVRDLELNGYALLPLPTLLQQNNAQTTVADAFMIARRALDTTVSNAADSASVDSVVPLPPIIDPSTDSGGWTGYHTAADANGRYNQHREGFVFSNGEMFNVKLDNTNEELPATMMGDNNDNISNNGNNSSYDCKNKFEHGMRNIFRVMHDDVAQGVLRAIERRLDLPPLYFSQEVGPTDISSQWHMKRYVVVDKSGGGETDRSTCNNAMDEQSNTLLDNENQVEIFLPVHTDPSLISVVIVDRAGINEGGMGLEVFDSPTNTWKEISHHGHDVAIIFVGSVLSYLTKRQIFSALKHRVVNWRTGRNNLNERMAATLFVRPHPDALMKPLPSPHLEFDKPKKNPPTFRAWNAKVAKNYMKKKKKGSRAIK